MPDLELKAEARTVLGKKVAALRRGGLTPANIFGHNVVSQAIQIPTPDLTHTLRAAGGTRLLRLNLVGEPSARMVLVRHVSRKPTTDQLLHVDFYEVSMTERTTVEIPIVLVGSAPIAESGEGMVYQQVSSLTVECLPGDIPEHIDADISVLTGLHSAVHVADLALPPNVTTALDPTEVLVSVASRAVEEEGEAGGGEPEQAEGQGESA
jgi:large subunit ribosomal protein L25